MSYVACETKLLSVVRSSIHSWPGYLVAIGCAVVYYARLPMHLVQELNVFTVHVVCPWLTGIAHYAILTCHTLSSVCSRSILYRRIPIRCCDLRAFLGIVDLELIFTCLLRCINPFAADDIFGQYKMIQTPGKWLKPWQMGIHIRVLRGSGSMNTIMTGLRWDSTYFASVCFGRK